MPKPNSDYSIFGTTLMPLAKKNGLTWLDLCEKLGMSYAQLLPKLKGKELVGEHFVNQVATALAGLGQELSKGQIAKLKQAANEADKASG